MPTDVTALTRHLTADQEAPANPERAHSMAQYLKTSMPFYVVTQLARKQLWSEALKHYPIDDIGSYEAAIRHL